MSALVKASYYRDDGIVMMDYDRCIGCRYCEVGLPVRRTLVQLEAIRRGRIRLFRSGVSRMWNAARVVCRKVLLLLSAHRPRPGSRPDRPASIAKQPGLLWGLPDRRTCLWRFERSALGSQHLLKEHPSYRLRENLGTGPRVYYLPVDSEA